MTRWTGMLVAAALASVAACGSSPPPQERPLGNLQSGSYVHGSGTRSYVSFNELAHDASAVARLNFTGQISVEHIGPTPFSVSVMHVDRVLKGTLPSSTIKLRTLGAPPGSNEAVSDVDFSLSRGISYIAFLTQFTYGPGRETDQFVLVGGGLFREEEGFVIRLNPDQSRIPARLSLSDFEGQLN